MTGYTATRAVEQDLAGGRQFLGADVGAETEVYRHLRLYLRNLIGHEREDANCAEYDREDLQVFYQHRATFAS